MIKRGKYWIIFLIAFLFIQIAGAQPPIIQTSTFTSGYEISIPQIGTWIEGQDHQFNIHLTNLSNEYPIDNSSVKCYLHLYNNSGQHLFELEMIHSSSSLINNEWYINIAGDNITSPIIGGKVQCNSSVDNLGGIKDFAYEVTHSGIILSNAEAILYIALILINLLIFGFFFYWAIAIPFENKKNDKGEITKIIKIKYIKLAAVWFSYASFLWFFTIFTGIINNFISLEVYTNLISNLYLIFRGIGLGLTIFLLIFTFIKVWKDILWNDEIKKFGKAIIKDVGKK